jgi:hypothetical protein
MYPASNLISARSTIVRTICIVGDEVAPRIAKQIREIEDLIVEVRSWARTVVVVGVNAWHVDEFGKIQRVFKKSRRRAG